MVNGSVRAVALLFLVLATAPGAAWAEPDPDPTPVVVLHGWASSPAGVAPLADALRAEGRTVVAPSLVPASPGTSLAEYARGVAVAVEDALAGVGQSGARFDLVGFSLGGLVARLLVDGGWEAVEPLWSDRVRRVVVVAAPLSDSPGALAELACWHLPDHPWNGVSCGIAPSSPLWDELPSRLRSDAVEWHALASRKGRGDGVIPYRSTILDGVIPHPWKGRGPRRHVRLLCNAWFVESAQDLLRGEEPVPGRGRWENLCR